MSPHAIIHEKMDPSNVGFDVSILDTVLIEPHCVVTLRTGIRAISNAENIYLRVTGRSGLTAAGYLVQTGVIDKDYFGEIKVIMLNQTDFPVTFNSGARIAQIVPEYYANRIQLYMLDDEGFNSIRLDRQKNFPATRGDRGFGSSGM